MASEEPPSKYSFQNVPVLSSYPLILREIEPYDCASMIEISFYDGLPARDEEEAVLFLERIKSDQAKGESIHWGICLEGHNEVAGTIGFYRGFSENVGEIGYILKSTYRGQGLMTEAVNLVVAFGINVMQLSKIVAFTKPINFPSMAVLKRAGFQKVADEKDDIKFEKYAVSN